MSLSIDVDAVTAVLLADGWHDVLEGSFDLDSYEFTVGKGNDERILHGGGDSDICAIGFTFAVRGGDRLSGPLTSILAVKVSEE